MDAAAGAVQRGVRTMKKETLYKLYGCNGCPSREDCPRYHFGELCPIMVDDGLLEEGKDDEE